MELRLARSAFTLAALATGVCVLLIVGATNASVGDQNAQLLQVSDRWEPKSEKDKWRAFKPEKQTSTSRWWEEKLDDDLWNPKDHMTPPDKPETSAMIESRERVSAGVVSEHETPATDPPKTEATIVPSTVTTTRIRNNESGRLTFMRGEINSFVEPDPGAYYRSSGESYGDTFWDYSYSRLYRDRELTEKPESKVRNVPQKNKLTGSTQENKNPSIQDERRTPGAPDENKNPGLPKETEISSDTQKTNRPSVPQEDDNYVAVQNKGKSTEGKAAVSQTQSGADNTAEINDQSPAIEQSKKRVDQKETAQRSTQTRKSEEIGTSSKVSTENEIVFESSDTTNENEIHGAPNRNNDLILQRVTKEGADNERSSKFYLNQTKDINITEIKHKVEDNNAAESPQQKLRQSGTSESNAFYGGEKQTIHAKTTVRPSEGDKFVDWADWDSKVFDYYEDEDEDDSPANNKSNDKEIIENKNKNIVLHASDDKTDHEFYYDSAEDDDDDYDDDDEDDSDDSDDLYEADDRNAQIKDKQLITQDQNSNVSGGNKSSSAQISLDKLKPDDDRMQSDQGFSQSDPSGFSQRDTYHQSYPHHKPSVKKDLTNPANIKKVSQTAEHPDVAASKESLNLPDKNELKLSPEHPAEVGGISTKARVAETVRNESVAAVTTPAISKTKLIRTLGQNNIEVNNGFILSFPIEFCKVDNDCRAGRTCILGVCKCYTASMCAGHHKQICGSDGLQYASHCELHRVACVNRIHVRVDRSGKCFQKDIQNHEKSWMEQEKSLQERAEKQRVLAETEKKRIPSEAKTNISHHETYPFPQDIKKDLLTSDVKKSPGTPNNKASVGTNEAKSLDQVSSDKKECSQKEMADLKEALLMLYCRKFQEPNCKLEVKTEREYLSMLIFSYYDKDYDYYLTAKELDDKERDEHLSSQTVNCHLHDFIKYADTLEADGKLTISEFTAAFEIPASANPTHPSVEVIPTLASAGNGLELKCGISAPAVIWKRHDIHLSDDKRNHQLMVFDDGALFFSTVGLEHIGNYTCVDASDETRAQIHTLKVQSVPVVEVTPVTQTHMTGSDIELKCHAEGVPKPTITWKHGGEKIPNSSHVTSYYGGGHIVIRNAQFDVDAGTYTCSAHSQAGTSEKSISVSVLPPSALSSKESPKEAGTFVVFHSNGISAYNPLRCLLRHQVLGDFGNFKYIPDDLDAPMSLCHKSNDCLWGGAVKVGSEFIYVSQPDQNRVVVVHVGDILSPLQVIDTDRNPEKLWYVTHLDQVWVLCGSKEHGEGSKTVVVIRDASQHIQHRSVHTQPVGNHFDMVQDLFIAPPNDLQNEFAFGYVSHRDHKGLFKLKLEDMSYVKTIDLNNYGCVPTNIAFVPIGGHVVIQCVSASDQHTLQLIMDYLTDTITSTTSLNGHPMASPDSRHLVTVDQFTGKVIVTSVSDEGILEVTYEVTVSAGISDVAFIPATSHQGYDLVLTSADDNDVIIMNLVTGKVEKIPGSQYTEHSASWHPSPKHRHIVNGHSMSSYLMAPSRSSLAILDIKFKLVVCEFLDSVGSNVMIYIPSSYTR